MQVIEGNFCLYFGYLVGGSLGPFDTSLQGAHIFGSSCLQHGLDSTMCTLGYCTLDLLNLESNQILIRKPVLLKFIADLHVTIFTMDLRENANMSPGNSLFFGIIST